MTQPDHDVIVIGAGAAGIAATRALEQSGRDVLCLEAADRVGGRAHTDTRIFGVPFDTGAHWLHCAHVNALAAPGRAMGLDIYDAPDRALTPGLSNDRQLWDQVSAVFAAARAAAEEDRATERATGRATDRSLADVFAAEGPWAPTVKMLSGLSLARDLADISLRDMSTWEGGRDLFCREGFGHLVAQMAGGLPIRCNSPVRAIDAAARAVRVRTDEATLSARAVIVTASVGVLADDIIRFDPPLETDRRRALDHVTMGDYNHAALLFQPGTLPVAPDTWLTYRLGSDVADLPRGGGFLCNISGTGLTCMETAGSFSRELQAAGPQAAIDHALESLVEVFGTSVRRGFVKGHATAWRHAPFVRGSYSGARPGGADQRAVLRRPHAGLVHFAGEATHFGQQATVSGAWLEGQRAAAEAMATLAA